MAVTTLSPMGVPGPPQTFTPKGAAGTITVVILQATEADTAQVFARQKRRSVGQPVETDVAQTIGRRKIKAIGQVVETDESQTIARRKNKVIGQVVEADSSQAITRIHRKAIGQVGEIDTAQVITRLATGFTYSSYGEAFLYTAADWLNVTIKFEAHMRAITGTAYARLYNETTANPVIFSEVSTTSSTFVLVRSAALSLTDGHVYRAQLAKTAGIGGQAECHGVHLVAYRT